MCYGQSVQTGPGPASLKQLGLLSVSTFASRLLLTDATGSHDSRGTEATKVPVIGIGAGAKVDGQILVLYDVIDIAPGKRTRFSKNYLKQAGSIQSALGQYVKEVKEGLFPTEEYSFK